jgi:hypothetical protein
MGSTCKKWGNPRCESVTLSPAEPEPLHPGTPCDLDDADVFLCADDTCREINVNKCTVLCHNWCQDSVTGYNENPTKLYDSTVQCQPEDACKYAQFIRSVATCTTNGSCANSKFYASAAKCDIGACQHDFFSACSYCDGHGCPVSGVPSCLLGTSSEIASFCAGLDGDLTCAQQYNPVCEGVVF